MALDWGEGLEKNSGIFSFAGVVDVLRACMWYARLNPQQPKEEHKHGESKENEKIWFGSELEWDIWVYFWAPFDF